MSRHLRLGSIFYAFIAGSVFSSGLALLTAPFIGNELPEGWWVVLGGGVLLCVAGLVWASLSVQISDTEAAEGSLPSSLSPHAREAHARKLREGLARRASIAFWVATVLTVIGFAALPLRFVGAEGDQSTGSSSTHCDPVDPRS